MWPAAPHPPLSLMPPVSPFPPLFPIPPSPLPMTQPPDTLEWTVRLYEAQPWKRWVVLVGAVFAGAIGYLLLRHPVFAMIGLLAVLATTAEFWAPLKYTLNANRASVRCVFSVTAIDWMDVKRAVVAEEGIKLSPLAQTGRTSPFRGVLLRFAGNADAVREFVARYISEDARIVEYGADG